MNSPKIRSAAVMLLAAMVAGPLAGRAWAFVAVSPLKQEVNVKPGATAEFFILISNKGPVQSGTQRVRVELVDVEVAEEGAIVFSEPGSVADSASKWICLSKSSVVLAPGETEKIHCTVTAPYTAVGEYYSAVMVTLARTTKNEKSVVVTYRIASGVFVTILGQTFPKEAKITRCECVWPQPPSQATPAPATTAGKPKIVAAVKNAGRSRFDASGSLTVTDARGRVFFEGTMISRRSCIFAGDERRFECPLTKALPPGEYRAKVAIDYQSKWAKTYKELPLTVSPDQALLLAQATELFAPKPSAADPGTIHVSPDRLSAKVPAGGMRSLSFSVRNEGESPVQCTAAVAADGDAIAPPDWVSLESERFMLDRGQSKNVPLAIRVPPGATGVHTAMLTVESVAADGSTSRAKLPLEMTVREGPRWR